MRKLFYGLETHPRGVWFSIKAFSLSNIWRGVIVSKPGWLFDLEAILSKLNIFIGYIPSPFSMQDGNLAKRNEKPQSKGKADARLYKHNRNRKTRKANACNCYKETLSSSKSN